MTSSTDPSRLIIGSYTSVSIRCSSDLDVTRVEWYENGNRVISSGYSYSSSWHSSLLVTTEGLQYRCSAISPYVTQEKNITFSVIGTLFLLHLAIQ